MPPRYRAQRPQKRTSQGSLPIVGADDAVNARNRPAQVSDQCTLQFWAERAPFLPINPENLLLLRDHASLVDGRFAGVFQHPSPINPSLPKQSLKLLPLLVRADDAGKVCAATHAPNVVSHVGSSAEAAALRRPLQHLHWGLRRDPVNETPDIAVEHNVAHDQYIQPGEGRQDLFPTELHHTIHPPPQNRRTVPRACGDREITSARKPPRPAANWLPPFGGL